MKWGNWNWPNASNNYNQHEPALKPFRVDFTIDQFVHHFYWPFPKWRADIILVFLQANNNESVLSHLLGLLGFLLRIPRIPVVHTSLLLRWRSEQTVYKRGRGCLWGRYSPMVVAGGQGCRVVVVPNHLTVCWWSSFYSRALLLLPGQGLLGF